MTLVTQDYAVFKPRLLPSQIDLSAQKFAAGKITANGQKFIYMRGK